MQNNFHKYHLSTMAERIALGHRYWMCPGCGKKTFHPYVDEYGQMLDENVGRCDRENSCGYHFTPKDFFRQGGQPKALPEGWTPPEPRKRLALPRELMFEARKYNDNNGLLRWMRGFNWDSKKEAMLEAWIDWYCVGTCGDWLRKYGITRYTEGDTIFWQIDNSFTVRGGKTMEYLPNGHRNKANKYSISSIQSKLFEAKQIDPTKYEAITCLFGEHLLKYFPDATVMVVESEKTALICSAFEDIEPKRIWIATGGLSHISDTAFEPLRNRRVRFIPDMDGINTWPEKIEKLNFKDAKMMDIVQKMYDPTKDPDNADMADILLRREGIISETEYEKAKRLLNLKEDNEPLKRLITELNLKVCKRK